MGSFGEYSAVLVFALPFVLVLCIAFVMMGLLMPQRSYGRIAFFAALAIAAVLLAPAVIYPLLSASERRELLEGPGAPTLMLGTFSGLMVLPIYWLGRFANGHRNKRFN